MNMSNTLASLINQIPKDLDDPWIHKLVDYTIDLEESAYQVAEAASNDINKMGSPGLAAAYDPDYLYPDFKSL